MNWLKILVLTKDFDCKPKLPFLTTVPSVQKWIIFCLILFERNKSFQKNFIYLFLNMYDALFWDLGSVFWWLGDTVSDTKLHVKSVHFTFIIPFCNHLNSKVFKFHVDVAKLIKTSSYWMHQFAAHICANLSIFHLFYW